MIAAKQRLLDMGFAGQTLEPEDLEKPAGDAAESDAQIRVDREITVEDEVKMAPWRLTTDFLDCVQGKCLLTLTGLADPCGGAPMEGYSYVRLANKPVAKSKKAKDSLAIVPRAGQKMSEGKMSDKDKDLRKLNLREARQLLVTRYNYDPNYLKEISRWQVIHIVR